MREKSQIRLINGRPGGHFERKWRSLSWETAVMFMGNCGSASQFPIRIKKQPGMQAVSDDDVVIWDSAAQVRYLPPILARDLGAVLKWFSLAVSVLGNRVRRVNSDA